MRTVRHADGNRYLLLKESAESSLVRDPATGEERHVPNAELEPVDGESPLATAAESVDDAALRLVTAVPDRRGLGLLVELDARGPLGVHVLLDSYDLCESDLHGLLAEFRAAGLVEATDVGGRRGYGLTDDGHDALDRLRD
jgi:hypothetical protein